MLLWVVLVLDLGVSAVTLPEITDEKFIAECVEEHNKARSAVIPPANNMLYMSWDEALAITARAWANHCNDRHNVHLREAHKMHPTFASVGENIWTGPLDKFSVKSAIQKWVDEENHYSYKGDRCTSVCSYYRQVVWAQSYKIGCAVVHCPQGIKNFDGLQGAIFVCNYAPGGDIDGIHPYATTGNPCSGCQGECDNKLCRNLQRESRKRYNWAPGWDTATPKSSAAPTNTFLDILIVRPIGVILTCIAAYVVHYFYPNLFCYE
ncbi:GLIPR1-like protein 1 isoform X2 [Poecilia reticulata]|nr:PREDICTED: glioma pathogenesis-related protein 1 isoform X1 [Poecilia reticulata]XP_008399599.1 PREDICTED: glioma pathogenesis-related protein 1 isoform X1 [Poecilia reticulata]XP_017158197.1 PREDICTED: glioma pathogenesis-related protein 1 isoform X2 [Poecilia reticulata]